MRTIPVTPSMDVLPLGRLGENECTQFVFDVSEWLEEYPGASFSLTNKLPHSSEGYPCTLTAEGDGKYSWTITSAELTVQGDGECELQATKGDAVIKGKIYKTKIGRALDDSASVPDPWESWITELTELQEAAEDAAEDADDAASDAEAYAVGKRGGTDVESSDPAYHNNSKYYSEQAESSASAAAGSATTAGNKASDSEAYAVGKRGGQDVESGDAAYHNNSKYYAEQASAAISPKANRSVVAKEYADLTYPVTKGTWCFHEGVLYEANQAISTSETWTAAHWTELTVEAAAQSLLTEINSKQDAPSATGTEGQVLTLDSNLDPVWQTPSGGGTVDSSMSTSSTNPVQNKVISGAVNAIDDDVASLKNNGMSHFYPKWEVGTYDNTGKKTDGNQCRSTELIYLESGTYTIVSTYGVFVHSYSDASYGSYSNLLWNQTGTKTFTVTTRHYIGISCKINDHNYVYPNDTYAVIPTSISKVISDASGFSSKITANKLKIIDRTEYTDGIYTAVLDGVTVTENKGIGNGILVGSKVTLSDDNYAHVMVAPVVAGNKYRLKARVPNGYYLAHFTDADDYLIEKTGLNSTGSTTTYVDVVVTAPEGATKLYISGNKNVGILCDVFEPYTIKDMLKMECRPTRGSFCFMQFNVGDWYEGRYREEDHSGQIPADETIYSNYMQMFNSIFSRYRCDIAMINEDAQEMCLNRHDDSRAFLGKYFKYIYRGLYAQHDYTNVYVTLASNYELEDVEVIYYTDTEPNQTKNLVKGYTYLNGKKVCLICTHLSSQVALAKLEATELLSIIQTENPEYMVCCGDFNYGDDVAEIAAFETAGYTISHGNTVYDGHTYGYGDLTVTTSNIEVKSVFCDEQKIENSFVQYIDHLPTIVYLEIF